MLWRRKEPVGICIFSTPAFSLRCRNRFFGLSGKRTKLAGRALNQQLITLSRVVIDPKYRGAGIASAFVRRCCELTEWPWVEALAQMGTINPFFERAGFRRVGRSRALKGNRDGHSRIYGCRKLKLSAEAHRKSEFAEPVYYIFDNRVAAGKAKRGG